MAILRRWFLLIQEPRVVRLGMLLFYISIVATGASSFTSSPDKFFLATNANVVYSLGGFLVFGGVCGIIAILPGTWWLERIGLVSIAFGIALRGVLIEALGVSLVGALFLLGEVLLIAVRFISIRRADLAPIAG